MKGGASISKAAINDNGNNSSNISQEPLKTRRNGENQSAARQQWQLESEKLKMRRMKSDISEAGENVKKA